MMRRFAELFEGLDTTTSTHAKIDALVAYFATVEASDAAWAIYVLIGRRLKRAVGPGLLRAWLGEVAGLPQWLVDETYGSVGDLAETIALLVPDEARATDGRRDASLTEWFEARILPLAKADVSEKRERVIGWWRELPYRECFLVGKLLTGSLRVGVSRGLVTRALAERLDRPRVQIERALMGEWWPSAPFWRELARPDGGMHLAHPYPFYLASALDEHPERLGARQQWLAEWKWDGIRGQIVRRGGECVLWSRGEEIVTPRFPEIVAAAAALPDGTVLDGEVLAWRDARVMPFARLQQRIGRSKLTPKILAEVPVRFVAYDLLEADGIDWRARTLRERRSRLEQMLAPLADSALAVSPDIRDASWADLATKRDEARRRGVEGLMLKDWNSAYGVGRQRGAWWKWKIEPRVFDGVLLYAAPGHGRRSNLYTDYTFGVWNGAELVPIAKAYSGLTDVEIARLDQWIRAHTREKFGIVRSVQAAQVFELAYEGIAASARHKSGIALRFPRILRWRTDKPAAEADTLAELRAVLTASLADGAAHAG
jgi:DNA ligase-1